MCGHFYVDGGICVGETLSRGARDSTSIGTDKMKMHAVLATLPPSLQAASTLSKIYLLAREISDMHLT